MKKMMLSLVSSVILATFMLIGGAYAAAPDNSTKDAIKVANEHFRKLIIDSADGHDGNPLKAYNIVAQDTSDANNVQISVELVYEGSEALPPVPYFIVKENGSYKVKETIVQIDLNPLSPNYKKVRVGNAKISKGGDIITYAVISGSFYADEILANSGGLNSSTTTYFGHTFSNTKTNITINGWQEKSSGTESLSLRYGIAVKNAGGVYTDLATSSLVTGNVPQNGTWFNRYLTNVTVGNNRCVFVENTNYSKALVAGNAYE
ncbi:hypothetical protein PCCS19_25230 [Paenibacillus sp. CCS19]|uniref:hypothetical protein n=1 Tax=Paenibacillus sp. CCS19 TaxID=3158387 RepID=UPI00256D8140|nr:hypothetical protein [Paenibacillus cellulosilyticus]GMK39469.1 hypothetical protein PCCS19_25230 [Paenibacillus cellulosilyticus]